MDTDKEKKYTLTKNLVDTVAKASKAARGDEGRKAKVSSYFLNPLFTTEDTLKGYQKQLTFFKEFSFGNDLITKEQAAKQLDVVIKQGEGGLALRSSQEIRVMKGLFSLLNKQKANEDQPYIVLNNISQLYDEILEKKVTKKKKAGYEFKDFSGGEVKRINNALDNLENTLRDIVIKVTHKGEKGRLLYDLFLAKEPLIKILWAKENISKEELANLTEAQLKETGQVKISILPIFLKNYHKYFKMLPIDISREVRKACPDIKRVSEPEIDFIHFLWRQDRQGLTNGNEFKRTRLKITKDLGLLKQLRARGKKYIKEILLKCYDTAKRTGYLEGFKTDYKGKDQLFDVFFLNISKYDHLRPREAKEALKKRLDYAPRP